ncbi:MAG: alpha/beta hydrolase [Bacteroidales bacterium]
MKMIGRFNRNVLIHVILAGFLLLTFSFGGCERRIREVTELRKGEWFIADELGIALKFEADGKTLKGKYILTTQEASPLFAFEASRKWQRWDFTFDGHQKKKLKGVITESEGGYMVQGRGQKKLFLRPAPLSMMPRMPGRYASVITTRVNRTAKTYGYASGYYASKPFPDMSSNRYPEIILSVLSEVTSNMFSDSIRVNMDIYEPVGDTVRERPLILLIHGGAFVVGDKRDSLQIRLATYFAQCGYVVASINYRMGYPFVPGVYAQLERGIYRAVQDVRAALRFLSENKTTYRINPDMVFVAGNSAGGFLSLFTAFMEEHERWGSTRGLLFGLRKDQGCLDCSTNSSKGKYRVAGVVNLWGGLTDLEMVSGDEKIPVLMVHGTADRIVPYGYDYPFTRIDPRLTAFFSRKLYGSEPITGHMRGLGYDVKLITIPDGNHEPQDDDTAVYPMMRREMSGFFFRIQSGTPLEIRPVAAFNVQSGAAKYEVVHHRNEAVNWRCLGGLIISRDAFSADVVWFDGAKRKELVAATVSGTGVVRTTVYNR